MNESKTQIEIAILKTLGETVRRCRKARQLSIDALAEQCGLSPNYIGSIELGRRDISFSTLRTLAQAFGVAPKDVLSPPPPISQNAADAVRWFEASTPAMRKAMMALSAALHPASNEKTAKEESPAHKKQNAGFDMERDAANRRESSASTAPTSSEELGTQVRRLRKQQRLTIEALAQRSHLWPNQVVTIERGNRDAGILSICAIAKGLGMRARDVLGGGVETVSDEALEFASLFDGEEQHVERALVTLLLAHLGKPPDGA